MPVTGAVVGAQVLGGMMGGKKAKKAAKRARAAQAAAAAAQQARLDAIDDPVLKQQMMEQAKLVGLQQEAQIGESALQDVEMDPRMQEAQMAALQGLQERAESGFSAEDRAQLGQMQRGEDARAQSAQKGIMSEMAQRGTMDSGMGLAAKLSAQQGSAQRSMEGAEQMAAQGAAAKRQALMQAGQMAGVMGSQDFERQSQKATARDVVDRFNIQNRANTANSNLAARQGLADRNRNIRYDNQRDANTFEQNKYNNALAKAGGANRITQQGADAESSYQNAKGAGEANMWSSVGNAAATGISGYAAKGDAKELASMKYNKNHKW
jgi:hypothetical protein